MAIHSVSSTPLSSITGATKSADKLNAKATAKAATPTDLDTEAAVFEKSEPTSTKTTQTYTRDTAKLSEINRQVEEKYANLRSMVETLFTKQSVKKGESGGLTYDQILEKYNGNLKSFYENLQVDDATRLQAQQDISSDGYYGVEQSAKRIIDFAIGLSGGDPSKLAVLKSAIQKGYSEAQDAWGGALPDICKQTIDAALKGLDDWAAAAKATS